ncbi:MAG: hypothetical protein RLZZ176_2425 [Cyanobacteriota bacterium]
MLTMIKNRPIKRHEINPNRPPKTPVVSQAELEFYDQKILDSILLFRRLGYGVNPPNGFPQPPNPQFTDPE